MIKSFILTSLFTCAVFVGSASAQTQKLVCDEAKITSLERGAAAISDVAKREAAMKSVTSMRQMMSSKDTAGCEARMNTHMKDYGSTN